MNYCVGCGTEIPLSRGGRARKWCTDKCRKSKYDLECVQCGGRVNGTTPGRSAGKDPVCVACAPGYYKTWTPDAVALAIQEWADNNGGIPPSANDLFRARALGDETVPAVNTVINVFGSWNAGVIAAGFEPHAIGPVGGFTPLTAEQRAEIARRYDLGESLPQLAAAFNCSTTTIATWVRRGGATMRPRTGRAAA